MTKMEVVLLAYTQVNPDLFSHNSSEWVCAVAMRSCKDVLPAHKIFLTKQKQVDMIEMAKKVQHFSVLEHVSMTFSIAGVSRTLTHQLVRHRIATFSQQSQRFVKMNEPNYVMPDFDDERKELEFEELMDESWALYNKFVESGVKPEDARFVIPNACKSNITLTMNAHSLLHFFKLRLDSHAQWEIRELAHRMYDIAKEIYPTIFNQIPEGI